MIRSWKYWVLLGVIAAVAMACSQQPSTAKEEAVESTEEEAFAAENGAPLVLSEDELPAFEQQALQNLHDLYDLMNLLLDPNLDRSFRKQVQKQAVDLFVKDAQVEEVASRAYFRRFAKDTSEDMVALSISDLLLSAFQARRGEGGYESTLSFVQTARYKDGTEKTEAQQLRVYIVKEEKRFGKETQLVWVVAFGDLR